MMAVISLVKLLLIGLFATKVLAESVDTSEDKQYGDGYYDGPNHYPNQYPNHYPQSEPNPHRPYYPQQEGYYPYYPNKPWEPVTFPPTVPPQSTTRPTYPTFSTPRTEPTFTYPTFSTPRTETTPPPTEPTPSTTEPTTPPTRPTPSPTRPTTQTPTSPGGMTNATATPPPICPPFCCDCDCDCTNTTFNNGRLPTQCPICIPQGMIGKRSTEMLERVKRQTLIGDCFTAIRVSSLLSTGALLGLLVSTLLANLVVPILMTVLVGNNTVEGAVIPLANILCYVVGLLLLTLRSLGLLGVLGMNGLLANILGGGIGKRSLTFGSDILGGQGSSLIPLDGPTPEDFWWF